MTDEKATPPGENLPPATPADTESTPVPEALVASVSPQAPATSGNPQTPANPLAPDTPDKLKKTPLPPPVPELNLEKRLKLVYADQLMTTAEFMALRDDADKLFEKLTARFPENGYLKLFQPLADVVVEAMQHAVLEVRRDKPDAEAKALTRQCMGFQVAYIKASLDRLTQSM